MLTETMIVTGLIGIIACLESSDSKGGNRGATIVSFLCAIMLMAQAAYAAEQVIPNLPTPDTVPNRSIQVRGRLVDLAVKRPWKGSRGESRIVLDLGKEYRLGGAMLHFKRGFRGRLAQVLVGTSPSPLMPVSELAGPRGSRRAPLLLNGFDRVARYVEIVLYSSTSRGRRGRAAVPRLTEIQLMEVVGAGPAPSPTPSPGPTASPTPSPSPTASPTPSPTSTPTPSPTSSPTPTPIPLQVDMTEVVSVDSNGAQGTREAKRPSVSDNGRWVAFDGDAAVFSPTSGVAGYSVYLRDRQSGTTQLVSEGLNGKAVLARDASISGDGKFVAYSSRSNGIVSGDNNNGLIFDIFLYDVDNDQTVLISKSTAGVQSSGSCFEPYLSGNGRYVTFYCDDTSFDARDINTYQDIYLHDVLNGTTTLISVDSNGVIGNDPAYNATVSDDGRLVVWDSRATNLILNDSNNTSDVFARDTVLGQTFLVSVNEQGQQSDQESDMAHISGDGRYVAFQSFATNLVPGPTSRNIFRHDLITGENILISRKADGTESGMFNYWPSISDDGRYIAFDSDSDTLAGDTTQSIMDVFLYDVVTEQMLLVSRDNAGQQGNGDSSGGMGAFKSLSGDGTTIVYRTEATNLFADDLNNRVDLVATTVSR